MAAAALGLHELRSEARLGEHAQPELVHNAHGYLGTLTLVVGVLVAIAAAHLLVRLAVGWRSDDSRCYAPHRTLRLWRLASVALVCVCFGQEVFEGFVATGQPVGLEELLGRGGWTAIPLAVLFGGAVAVAVRGSDAAIAFAARSRHGAVRLALGHEQQRLAPGHPRPHEPLADLAARRAPPPPSVAS